jgi:hypothetical protein
VPVPVRKGYKAFYTAAFALTPSQLSTSRRIDEPSECTEPIKGRKSPIICRELLPSQAAQLLPVSPAISQLMNPCFSAPWVRAAEPHNTRRGCRKRRVRRGTGRGTVGTADCLFLPAAAAATGETAPPRNPPTAAAPLAPSAPAALTLAGAAWVTLLLSRPSASLAGSMESPAPPRRSAAARAQAFSRRVSSFGRSPKTWRGSPPSCSGETPATRSGRARASVEETVLRPKSAVTHHRRGVTAPSRPAALRLQWNATAGHIAANCQLARGLAPLACRRRAVGRCLVVALRRRTLTTSTFRSSHAPLVVRSQHRRSDTAESFDR